ncbi:MULTISPECIES: ABC transporter permease [Mesorhizobium]|uniref:Simple sugar transport system permease protein n=1 Tax=Mesorhizobium qingshengii TaxID=1165689 RepID=A0A1G5ZWV1_9HYPH|nr:MULTISPECIES: ABC transporter permease [Mesorhizobium]MCH4560638.1 ABC transporter permease [Mesorhizobium jarvisii]SDA99100.1 simple sugar transport system permease protein [Mesorhizobium qingshengii]
MDSDLFYSAIRISTPLIFAAMGGLLTFKAGMLNIALDGFMILAAFAAVVTAYWTGSLTLAILMAMVCAVALAGLLALFNLRFKADIFIAGIAVTFLAYGLTALLLKGMLDEDGVFASTKIPKFPAIDIPGLSHIPWIGPALNGHTLLVYLSYLTVPVVAWVLYKTRWGLRVRVVGEAEDAARAAGISTGLIKVQTMLLSGAFCGLAGAYLSLGYVSLFANKMTNDRGLIALAAIFFAKGKPFPTALVALLFGLATALSVRLPEVTGIAPQLLQLIPYVVTIIALVFVGIRNFRAQKRQGAWRFDIS